MGFAQTDTSIDEQRVVGGTGIGRYLHGGGAGKVVGAARDVVFKAGSRAQPRAGVEAFVLQGRVGQQVGIIGRGRRCARVILRFGSSGAARLAGRRAHGQFHLHLFAAVFHGQFLNARQIAFLHPVQHAAVWRQQAQPLRIVCVRICAEHAQPGVDLLLRQFVFQTRQAMRPKLGHRQRRRGNAGQTVRKPPAAQSTQARPAQPVDEPALYPFLPLPVAILMRCGTGNA